jgi:5-methylcytosine-specific restriction enzyme subunit McrC
MPIKIATLILDNDAVLFDVGSRIATTFLINMYQLFEGFVGQVLRSSSPPGTWVSLQHPATLDIDGKINMKPDVVWIRNGRPVAVADLKYKSIDNKTLPNADVYQALAYATALGLDQAHLIYAKGNEIPVQHDILHNNITIVVHAIDLDVPIQQMNDSIEHLGQSIAGERSNAGIAV